MELHFTQGSRSAAQRAIGMAGARQVGGNDHLDLGRLWKALTRRTSPCAHSGYSRVDGGVHLSADYDVALLGDGAGVMDSPKPKIIRGEALISGLEPIAIPSAR